MEGASDQWVSCFMNPPSILVFDFSFGSRDMGSPLAPAGGMEAQLILLDLVRVGPKTYRIVVLNRAATRNFGFTPFLTKMFQ